MEVSSTATLVDANGDPVAMQDVAIDAHLHELLAEVAVAQTYRNTRPEPIEVVYTFPLPQDAVLLGLEVQLGDLRLCGQVVKKSEAEEGYEAAIEAGDTAVLLEQATPGIYTVNLGNLLPGETAVIRFTYGLMLRWRGKGTEFRIPTTIAPRHGNPEGSGLMPHQQPEHDGLVELTYSLRVAVSGLLARGKIHCLTHATKESWNDQSVLIEFDDGQATLDRDFVLTLLSEAELPAVATYVEDDGGYVGWLGFRVQPDWVVPDQLADPVPVCQPRSVKILIDCSASMVGVGITQAQEAALHIVTNLNEQDAFNLFKFGKDVSALFDSQRPLTDISGYAAEHFIRDLSTANLGGPDLGRAFDYVVEHPSGETSPAAEEIVLITTGAISDTSKVVQKAIAAGRRVLVVGVGSAPAEPFLRELAEATGGACALVTPGDSAKRVIQWQLPEFSAPRVGIQSIIWPQPAISTTPLGSGPVHFAGDTVNHFGWFLDRPEGDIAVQLVDLNSCVEQISIAAWRPWPLSDTGISEHSQDSATTLARMAVWELLKFERDPERGAELAIKYQLVSPWTSYLVMHERDGFDRADGAPVLRRVPHMHVAGGKGLGLAQKRLKIKLEEEQGETEGISPESGVPPWEKEPLKGTAYLDPLAPMKLDVRDEKVKGEAEDISLDSVRQPASAPGKARAVEPVTVVRRAEETPPSRDAGANGATDERHKGPGSRLVKTASGLALSVLVGVLLIRLYPHVTAPPSDRTGQPDRSATGIDTGAIYSESELAERSAELEDEVVTEAAYEAYLRKKYADSGEDPSFRTNAASSEKAESLSWMDRVDWEREYQEIVADLSAAGTDGRALRTFDALMRVKPEFRPESVAIFEVLKKRQATRRDQLQRLPFPVIPAQPADPALPDDEREYEAIVSLWKEGDGEALLRFERLMNKDPGFQPEPVRIFEQLRGLSAERQATPGNGGTGTESLIE
jgi:Ca-activated chloride channel family protein